MWNRWAKRFARRGCCALMPEPHQRETAEYEMPASSATCSINATIGFASGSRSTLGANCGSIRTASAPLSRMWRRPVRMMEVGVRAGLAKRCVGADLPQHEIRILVGHLGIQAREHLARVLAADTVVDHADVRFREQRLDLDFEPAWIGGLGAARAVTLSGGRADRNNGDRLGERQPFGDALQRPGELRQLRRPAHSMRR